MENRFLTMDNYLKNLRAIPTDNNIRAKGSKSGRSRFRAFQPEVGAMSYNGFSKPFTASQRVLIVLIENGGIEIDTRKILEPLLQVIPETFRETAFSYLNRKIKEYTDTILESAELYLNNYAGSSPDFYGNVVILRNGTATFEELKNALTTYSKQDKTIDLYILTHGSNEYISVNGGGINAAKIESIKAANGGNNLRIRSVYMMNCYGSTLNTAWRNIGARVVSGTVGLNVLPEPTTYFLFKDWKNGKPFGAAVTDAYQKTINFLKDIIRNLPLPDMVKSIILGFDFSSFDVIKSSAPVVVGDQSVTIGSDNLSFSQTVHSAFALTVTPLHRLSLFQEVIPRTMTLTISQKGIDFILSYEGFRANKYNDAAGHCTIGYGHLIHRGNCNDDSSEAQFSGGITQERAKELFMERIRPVELLINEEVKTEMTQAQFDALCSFTFNVGSGAFKGSTLLKKLNAGDYDAVPVEMNKWVNAGGRKLEGLVKRRKGEGEMFSGGIYSNHQSLMGRSFENTPRGIRNNNPGNIRLTDQKWEGKVPNKDNTDKSFEQFTSYAYGVRALIVLLKNYITKGRNTITAIFGAYAPPNENNTQNYIRFVAERLGVGADAPLSLTKNILKELAQAIAKMENGVECISDTQFDEGFALLSDDMKTAIQQSFYFGQEYYYGMNAEEASEGAENDTAGIIAVSKSFSIPSYCPINTATTAGTEHFSLGEFGSKDGKDIPDGVKGNIQQLMEQLEVLRAEVGKPIKIVSGYRSPEHNSSVGGVSQSRHMCGQAADIRINDMTPAEVHRTIESLISTGKMRQGGLGLYNSFVHYDIRGTRARWNG
ncbi:MAG: glycoside hydrolase family protein [Chitinophagales bacterium]|nr:glycoside hydrolase family protein [Chitinophagales bacterium]